MTIWIVCAPVMVWPASSGCEIHWPRRMSSWVLITEVQLRVVIVEEVLVVPEAKRANCVWSVQPASGVGVTGEKAVDSR
jgi:hypothetical protein